MHATGSPFGPEEGRFLELAGALLVDDVTKHQQHLSDAVRDIAYDDAVTAIMRRARRGVSGFRDARGRQNPERIRSYVKYVMDRKVKGAWCQVEPTVPLDDADATCDLSIGHEDAVAEARRLVLDDQQQELLNQARQVVQDIERRARERDARRMSWIANLLSEHAIAGPATRVIMLRAARQLAVDVTEHDIVIRYLPPMGHAVIAKALGITHVYARKLSSRTLQALPPHAARLIDDPESFE